MHACCGCVTVRTHSRLSLSLTPTGVCMAEAMQTLTIPMHVVASRQVHVVASSLTAPAPADGAGLERTTHKETQPQMGLRTHTVRAGRTEMRCCSNDELADEEVTTLNVLRLRVELGVVGDQLRYLPVCPSPA